MGNSMTTCTDCYAEKTGRCLNCKRNEYHRSQGVTVDRQCKTCFVIRPLASNGSCYQCLETAGLRECRVCTEVKIQLLEFQNRQGVCRACRPKTRSGT